MIQIVSLAGAITILAAFAMQQWGRWKSDDFAYLWANTIGAGLLTVVAWTGSQRGFLLLESVWTLVSIQGLIKRAHA